MSLSLLLDLAIILLLGATIFYALRLNRNLDEFRANRNAMEKLIADLGSQILRAQEGIGALDSMTKETLDELRGLLMKGRGLADELHIIVESGDSLANRIEQASTQSRKPPEQTAQKNIFAAPPRVRQKTKENATTEAASSDIFKIRDPDFESDDSDESIKSLPSKAERDLAKLIKSKQ